MMTSSLELIKYILVRIMPDRHTFFGEGLQDGPTIQISVTLTRPFWGNMQVITPGLRSHRQETLMDTVLTISLSVDTTMEREEPVRDKPISSLASRQAGLRTPR